MPRLPGKYTTPHGRGPSPLLDPSHPSMPGLVGYWGFGEGGGSVVRDLTGQSANGAWAGTLTNIWGPGAHGPGGVFDGTTNSVTIGQPAALNITGPLSLACWVNPTALSSGATSGLVTRDQFTTTRAWSLQLLPSGSGGNFRIQVVGATSGIKSVSSNAGATLGVWQHVVGLWDGATVWIYVNGVRQTASTPLTDGALASVAWDVALGRATGLAGTFLSGRLDEVGIWRRALTSAEIGRLYVERASLYLPRTRAFSPNLRATTVAAPQSTATTVHVPSWSRHVRATQTVGTHAHTGRPLKLARASPVFVTGAAGRHRGAALQSGVAVSAWITRHARTTVAAAQGTAVTARAQLLRRGPAIATVTVTDTG